MGVRRWARSVQGSRRAGLGTLGRSVVLIIGVVAVMIVALSSSASTVARRLQTRQAPQTRYSLVNGCYGLRSPTGGTPIAGAEGPFRMQAAALGIYLLYGPRGDFLVDAGGGTLGGVSTPSTVAEWTVDGSSTQGFTITNLATGTKLPVAFVAASGCAKRGG